MEEDVVPIIINAQALAFEDPSIPQVSTALAVPGPGQIAGVFPDLTISGSSV